MENKKHNGWTNRATWNAFTWLGNDKSLYDMMRSLNITEAIQFENLCGYLWGNSTPDGENLKDVNWQEIADAWKD